MPVKAGCLFAAMFRHGKKGLSCIHGFPLWPSTRFFRVLFLRPVPCRSPAFVAMSQLSQCLTCEIDTGKQVVCRKVAIVAGMDTHIRIGGAYKYINREKFHNYYFNMCVPAYLPLPEKERRLRRIAEPPCPSIHGRSQDSPRTTA